MENEKTEQKNTTSIGLTLVSNIDRDIVKSFHEKVESTFNCPTQHLFRQVISFVTQKKISDMEQLNESLDVLKSNTDFMTHFETFELKTRKESINSKIETVKNSGLSKKEKLEELAKLLNL